MTSFDPLSLIRPDIAGMASYTPILPFEVLSAQLKRPPAEIIKLDANENPYGPSPLVRQRLAEYPYLHIYPDPESRQLRQALSNYTGLPDEHLLVGHGADELIDLVMRLVLSPGDGVINTPPTFGMYPFDAAINGATVINVSRRADFSLDIAAVENAVQANPRAKLLFVTTPNNPDGSLLPAETLARLLALPLWVVVDEAYVEFAPNSFVDWVPRYPNLIVLRTFSKWAGLAGLRVGYGAFPLPIMANLWKIKQPYNVNVAGQIAALASLQDVTYLRANVQQIIETRQTFQQALTTIAWLQAYPSHSNFVLARVLKRDALAVKQSLAAQGILVRHYQTPALRQHLRFSIGTDTQMNALLEALNTQ